MYSRKVKAVFAFMVFLMAVGYLVLVLNSFPGFTNLFTGAQSGDGATKSLIADAQKTVDKYNCQAGMKPGPARTKCKRALEDIGSGYQTLSQPTDAAGTQPKDAQRNIDKSIEAFTLLVAIDPKSTTSKQALATAYTNGGKYELAMPLYKQLAAADPSNDLYLFAFAQTAAQANKKDVAIASFKKYLKLFPDSANTDNAKQALDALKNPQSGSAPAG